MLSFVTDVGVVVTATAYVFVATDCGGVTKTVFAGVSTDFGGVIVYVDDDAACD